MPTDVQRPPFDGRRPDRGGPTALTRAVEGAEDDPVQARRRLAGASISDADLVVGIASSGRTLRPRRGRTSEGPGSAATVGIACNRPSLLGAKVDLEIALLVGPEVITGSTRLKSGTATKLVLNMITTGAMVRIGKTFGNQMIDLQPSNEKLRIRTRRILREIAGIDDTQAAELLHRSSGHLKRALVAALAGVDPEQAQACSTPMAARCGRRSSPPRGRPTMTTPLLIGIDGGGTSTMTWLADASGKILGRGLAGPSNVKTVGTRWPRVGHSTSPSPSPSRSRACLSGPSTQPVSAWRGSIGRPIANCSTPGISNRTGRTTWSSPTTVSSSSPQEPRKAGASG